MPTKGANRQRCQKLYPELGMCEGDLCTAPAVERHHKDGNTANNERSNIMFLCRSCHVRIEGRTVRKFFEGRKRAQLHCANCGRKAKPLRLGRCRACARYFTVRGVERPYVQDGRSEKFPDRSGDPCERCGKPMGHCVAKPIGRLCGNCERVLRRNPEAKLAGPPLRRCRKGHALVLLPCGAWRCRQCHTEAARRRKAK